MPTPLYRFRLAPADKVALERMSKVYGAATPSAFIREMVTVMCSDDLRRAHVFFARLEEKITKQMNLPLSEREDLRAQLTAVNALPKAKVARKAPKRGKGRKPR